MARSDQVTNLHMIYLFLILHYITSSIFRPILIIEVATIFRNITNNDQELDNDNCI